MQNETQHEQQDDYRPLFDVFIRLGLIAALVALCLRVLSPFIPLLLWGITLAVAIYPLHQRLAKRLNDKQGVSASVIVLATLLVLGAPSVMLGGSFAGHIHTGYQSFQAGELSIKPPNAKVAEWPIVGPQLYEAWSGASDNLPEFVERHDDKLRGIAKWLVAAAGKTVGSMLFFLAAFIVAGVIMAFGESGSRGFGRVLARFSDPEKGARIQRLATATIRSVAVGVLGVALIQALLIGVGLMLAGIPAAGILAIVVLLLGIAQLPATLVTVPAIIYLWSAGDASATSNILYTVYLIVAGLADNVLKPLLLGRGVEAPMLVVLLGALGGMVMSGFIGLFLGAVVLAVGYQVLMAWVNEGVAPTDAPTAGRGG